MKKGQKRVRDLIKIITDTDQNRNNKVNSPIDIICAAELDTAINTMEIAQKKIMKMIIISNATDMDYGNKTKTLVDTIHATTIRRKDTPEMKRTKHLAATSKTMHGDTNGETKNLINIICTTKLDAAIDNIENAQMKVMDLINIPNATNDCYKTKTLVDIICVAETNTPKTAGTATNGAEEAISLSTIINDMKEAKSLDAVIDAM